MGPNAPAGIEPSLGKFLEGEAGSGLPSSQNLVNMSREAGPMRRSQAAGLHA